MKKFILAIMIVALFAMTGAAFAASVSNNIQVQASVVDACRITTPATNFDFGSYDPTDPADDTNGTSSISYKCTRNTTYWYYISRTNTMSSGSNSLTYQLYTDAGWTIPWDTAKTGLGTVSPNNGNQTLDIYGKITAQQNVPAGNYSENVIVTIEY